VRVAIVALLAFGCGLGLGLALRQAPASARVPRTASAAVSPHASAIEAESPTAIEIPRGSGTIRGRVLTEDLQPMADVLVVGTPDRGAPSTRLSRAPAGPEMDHYLADRIEEARWIRATRREARTDEEGRYVLRHLSDQDHSVRAYREGYEFRVHGSPGNDVRPDAEVDFHGKRLVRVAIVARGASDAPNPWLIIRGEKHSASVPWRANDRTYELEPGRYAFSMQAGRAFEYRSEVQEIDILDAAGQRIELTLVGKPSITGRVKLPEDFTTAHSVSVYAFPARSGEALDSASLRLPTKHSARVENGRYWITGLEPRAYFVAVGFGAGELEPAERVEVAGVTQHDITVAVPDPAACVTLRATGPSGQPLRNWSADSIIRHPNMGVTGGARSFRRADGALLVRFPRWDAAKWGELDDRVRYFVDVSAPGWGTIRRPCELGGAVDVRFREAARVRFIVDGFADCEFASSLSLTYHQGDRVLQWWSALDAEGAATLDTIQPGALQVTLTRDRSLNLLVEQVELKSGDNEVRLRIPRLFTFTASVPGESTGHVWIQGETGGAHRAPLGRDGVAYFELPAGEYTVGFGERKPVSARVPAHTTAVLR